MSEYERKYGVRKRVEFVWSRVDFCVWNPQKAWRRKAA